MEKGFIEIPFGAFDSELGGFEYTIPEGFEAEIKDGKVIVRKAESEDEKIRKWIIQDIQQAIDDSIYGGKSIDEAKKAIAWLEKQGEQKPVITEDKDAEKAAEEYRNFRMSCGIKDPVMLNEIEEAYYEGAIRQQLGEWADDDLSPILQGYVPTIMNKHGMSDIESDAITETAYYFYSLGKQKQDKPVEWSEEDESCLTTIINELEVSKSESRYETKTYDKLINWLKFIKDRVQPQLKQTQWKPSDEQMEALDIAASFLEPYSGHRRCLEELHKQLKEL